MRVQKVNDHTIRIFISFTELADRDISMSDLFQRSPKSEQLFWELIAQAREEVEFNLDQPFWIQATVSANDEFVITVMKQEEQIEQEKDKERKRNLKNRPLEWVYEFEDFEDLLAAVTRLPEFAQLRSGLYEYQGGYYLALGRLGSGKKKHLAKAVLDEYGVLAEMTKPFLIEHGKMIIPDNAVSALVASFVKRPN